MKRLTIGTALIITACKAIYWMLDKHGVAIIVFGALAFYSLSVYLFVKWQTRLIAEEEEAREANKAFEPDFTERNYHEGIEVITRICVN
jgi:hypothetical protein